MTNVIILAGGYGERLWPASTESKPKQFLSIGGGLSFFQSALLRAARLNIDGRILIATRAGLEVQCAKECGNLCKALESGAGGEGFDALSVITAIKTRTLIIAENCSRHTSAPIMAAVHLMKILSPGAHDFLVVTSDHVITPFDAFSSDVLRALKLAKDGYFVTFGISPTAPSTEYGYILTGATLDALSFSIDTFYEKPDKPTAERYLATGKCYWNSGMFCFNGDFLLNEMKKCTPEVSLAFSAIEEGEKPLVKKLDGFDALALWGAMDASYQKSPAIAIDRSIAEKTSRAAVVIARFSWDDIGSWDSFAAHCEGVGEGSSVGSEDCFVYSDIPVCLCGVKGLNIVIKNGKALIMKKGNSNLVRQIVAKEKAAKKGAEGE